MAIGEVVGAGWTIGMAGGVWIVGTGSVVFGAIEVPGNFSRNLFCALICALVSLMWMGSFLSLDFIPRISRVYTWSGIKIVAGCGVLGGPCCSQFILCLFSLRVSTHSCVAPLELIYFSKPPKASSGLKLKALVPFCCISPLIRMYSFGVRRNP